MNLYQNIYNLNILMSKIFYIQNYFILKCIHIFQKKIKILESKYEDNEILKYKYNNIKFFSKH